MDFRPILYILGIFLSIMALSMTAPMLIDLYWGNPDWKVFFLCIVITSFFGGSLILSNAHNNMDLSLRGAFMLMFLSWVGLSIFAALPFTLSDMDINYTDAFFEAVSGLTTTGSTVITGLDSVPPGLLIWRAILQWLGGIGIIIMAMSILPFLNVGGMQVFKIELSEDDKALPRAAKLASSIGAIYLAMTLLCLLAYKTAGMGDFDALAHSMTTIATGGFSTYDDSLGHFNSTSIETIAIIFMILSGMPFVLYLKSVHGNFAPLLRDPQVHWFLAILAGAIALTTLYLGFYQNMSFSEAFMGASFNITSLLTGTGYATQDYNQWGGFVLAMLFFLMAMGACAGSTSCGIKIFRFQIFYSVAKIQVKKLLHPNGVFIPHYNGKPIPDDVPLSVMSFLFLYGMCFIVLALLLSAVGLDFITALSGAMTAISNVGPGLGETIGPDGNFASLPDSAKWILSAGMLIGRLEILAAFVIFHPAFWRH